MNIVSNQTAKPIYLDYQATTPMDPRVLRAMMPWLTENFGNPHSVSHSFGWTAEDAISKARAEIASVIGAKAEEITFTSGATEANNLVFQGLARKYGHRKRHIVTVCTEHPCVLENAKVLEREGFRVDVLPVHENGLIDIDALAGAICDETLLVSVMAVQNEIGVIQPLTEIGSLCAARKTFFHTDAAQAFGKISLDVQAMNIDLMTFSAHKIYGPKGIGALYKKRRRRIQLAPLMHGGGQENGIRAGTLSPALCVAFGKAAELAAADQADNLERLAALRDRFLSVIEAELGGVILNGDRVQRYPGNLNLSFEGLDPASLIPALDRIAVSSGAACASGSTDPSPVIQALGQSEEMAQSSIRIGFGRFTSEADIDIAAAHIVETVTELRNRWKTAN